MNNCSDLEPNLPPAFDCGTSPVCAKHQARDTRRDSARVRRNGSKIILGLSQQLPPLRRQPCLQRTWSPDWYREQPCYYEDDFEFPLTSQWSIHFVKSERNSPSAATLRKTCLMSAPSLLIRNTRTTTFSGASCMASSQLRSLISTKLYSSKDTL